MTLLKTLTTGSTTYNIIDTIYPVGPIYMSINSTNPSTLFGGTWEQLKDRFLLASGDTYKAGNTGGEASHTLSTSEIPSHNHSFSGSGTTGANNRSHTHSYTKATAVQGHMLTIKEMPSHNHSWKLAYGNTDPIAGLAYATKSVGTFADASKMIGDTGGGESHSHGLSTTSAASGAESQNHTHTYSFSGTTGSTGSGNAHNNMPPYLAVYMWKRTA